MANNHSCAMMGMNLFKFAQTQQSAWVLPCQEPGQLIIAHLINQSGAKTKTEFTQAQPAIVTHSLSLSLSLGQQELC